MNEKKKFTKKQKAVTGAVAAATVAAISIFGGNLNNDVIVDPPSEIVNTNEVGDTSYELINTNRAIELAVYPPDNANIDITELYCNGELVTKAILPSGKLKSIPLIFSNLDNLELRFYKEGDLAGTGKFEEEKLYITYEDGVIEDEK